MKEWGTNLSNSLKIYLQLRQTNMAKPPVLRAHAAAKKLSAETRKRWTHKLCRNRLAGGMRQRAIYARTLRKLANCGRALRQCG